MLVEREAMQERRKKRERKKHTYHQGLCSLPAAAPGSGTRANKRPGKPGRSLPNESTHNKGGRTQVGERQRPSFWDRQEER